MVAYYQHDIASWMDGTEGLSDGEYRAYHVVCELIYLNNGPIILHESGIAGRCNQHTLAFRSNLKKLIEKGKIIQAAAGKISNKRVEAELVKIGSKRRKPPSDPQPTTTQPTPGPGEVRQGSDGGSAAKPLKNQEPTLFGEALEEEKKKIIKEDSEGAKAPSRPDDDPIDIRTELFRRGLSTLVKISGRLESACRPMIGKWLKACDDDCVLVLRAIEDADRNRVGGPVAWIEGAIRSKTGGRNGEARKSGGLGFGAIAERVRAGAHAK